MKVFDFKGFEKDLKKYEEVKESSEDTIPTKLLNFYLEDKTEELAKMSLEELEEILDSEDIMAKTVFRLECEERRQEHRVKLHAAQCAGKRRRII